MRLLLVEDNVPLADELLAGRAPLGQYLQPRQAGQTEVEDDQVIGFAAALIHRIAAIGQPIHGVALAIEAFKQFIGQGHMVFHQKQAHQSSSLSFNRRPVAASRSSSRTTPSAVSNSTS